jgi:hypothetical protein
MSSPKNNSNSNDNSKSRFSVTAMHQLPFVQDLLAESPLLLLFQNELEANHKLQHAEKFTTKQQTFDKKEGYFDDSDKTQKLADAVQKARLLLQDRQQATTKALDKHYRVTSLKIHPDRVGEESREAFEKLKVARDCLRQEDKRLLYLEQMLQIVQTFGESFAASSHDQWVRKHLPDVEMPEASAGRNAGPGASPARRASSGPTTGAPGAPLQLMGGITNDIPKKPTYMIQNLKSRRVQISMPVLKHDTHHFYEYCHAVKLFARNSNDDEEFVLAHIKKTQLLQQYQGSPDVVVDVQFPHNTIYEIRWRAVLNMHEELVQTPMSTECELDLTTEEQRMLHYNILAADELCKRRAGEIQHFVQNKLRHSDLDVVKRNQLMHQVIASGRSALSRLLYMLKEDGRSERSCTGIEPLREALELAAPYKKTLEAQLEAHSKRDGLKEFKVSPGRSIRAGEGKNLTISLSSYTFVTFLVQAQVADLLERGEAASWLEFATIESMKEMGGEPNRLYQLLVEGKGAKYNVLELDAATLKIAASRTDIFTSKQCQALESRKQEVEEKNSAEAARALEEAKKEREMHAKAMQAKAAKERDERQRESLLASLRATSPPAGPESDLQTGLRVKIQGLTSTVGAQLNGTTGTVELKQGDRYIVRCHKDGRLRSFPSKRLVEEGHGVSNATLNGDAGNESWACGLCTFLHEGSLAKATSCDICQAPRDVSRPGAAPTSPTRQKAPTTPTRQKIPASPSTNARSPGWIEAEVTSKQKKEVRVKGTKAQQGKTTANMQKFSNSVDSTLAAVSKKAAKQVDTSKMRCRHGKKCKFLKLGPDKCKFKHTPEELRSIFERSEQVHIEQSIVGWIIGKNGSHIQEMIHKSGAEIWVDQVSMPKSDMKIVHINGSNANVQAALDLVNATIARITEQDSSSPTFTEKTRGVPSVVDTSTSSIRPSPIETQGSFDGGKGSSPTVVSPSPPLPKTQGQNQWHSPQLTARSEPSIQPPPEFHAQPPTTAVPAFQHGVPRSVSGAIGDGRRFTTQPKPGLMQTTSVGSGSVAAAAPQAPIGSRTQQSRQQTRAGMSSSPPLSPTPTYNLLMFLKTQQPCIKGNPEAFCQWLVESEDIASIADLSDAVSDDEYLQKVLQQGNGSVGIKGFKRAAFKKAVLSAASAGLDKTTAATDGSSRGSSPNYPPELVCPISYVLMTNDPVIASDGFTYERAAIEAWFERQRISIEAAWEEIAAGSPSLQLHQIYERGVVSPMTTEKMPHLHLTPNHAVRNMARDIARPSKSA